MNSIAHPRETHEGTTQKVNISTQNRHWFFLAVWILLGMHQPLLAQNMWMWNQRTHPELEWRTLETEHFNIHFHQGLDSIARKGAVIAEQSYQPIMDQLQVQDFGITDIVFSAEDEIMNGFAMPSNQIFIWVSQNDVAGHFGGSDKWLKLVVTHEFQHVVQFQAHRTWAGVYGATSIPAWWLEGMAEYMTEVWRVGRSDSRMKIHTYRNTMNQLDAHDDGYAKVLYLAWKYGDSTLVNISNHRLYLSEAKQKYPYAYDFKTAFKASTGQSLEAFDEEWRRAMNTYYYGYKAQKESVEEVGEAWLLKGFARVRAASIAPDSQRVAVVGRVNSKMRDYGLYILNTDSSHAIKEIHHGRFNGFPAWSPDGSVLIIPEYHRGSHGSLVNDLRLINTSTHKRRWITADFRALHPVVSSNGKGVFFVAHPGETTQIYYQDITSGKRVQLSSFEGDIQIQNLDLSPDGDQLTFMIQDIHGAVDLAVINITGSDFHKVTNDPEEDVFPVWSADSKAIIYTSYRNSTPNLYRVDLDSLKITQMTDVAEGIYSRQRLPNSNKIIASTLADVDTVRIRTVEADRVAPELGLHIREPFNAWRTKQPDILMPVINMDADLISESVVPYKARQHLRPLARFFVPDEEGLFGMAVYQDALGKDIIQGGAILGWSGTLAGGYLSYLNLHYKPAIHFYGQKNTFLSFRRSFDYGFTENRNGFGLAVELPLNSGESLASNHSIRLLLQGRTREIETLNPIHHWQTGEEITNLVNEESKVGLTYFWKSQRPHRDQLFLPRDGVGVMVHAETTVPDLYGNNDYQQVWLEGFFNWNIPKLPGVFYQRLKWVAQSGDILVQDEIGFSESAPLYFSGSYWTTLRGLGLFDSPEAFGLRGQEGNYSGKELVYSVSEFRLPLIPEVPLNILGFGLQNLTIAGFFDYGYLPESETALHTYGAEFRFDLSLMKQSLITLAYGWGGDEDYWDKNQELNNGYIRLAMVNPF